MAAFQIPPCPKCSGVLRPDAAADVDRCRCGFEVDGIELHIASRQPDGPQRVAHLLRVGRMIPIPQRLPGIRVDSDAGALRSIGWDHRYEPWRPGARESVAAAVSATAIERGYEIGLVHAGEALGAMLALPGGRTLTERHHMYGLAPAGAERECARRMVDAIVAAHGPGRWWTLAGSVHFILSDGDAAVCDVGGVPHVALRALYFHDAAPRAIGCVVEGDGGQIEMTEAARLFRADDAPPREDGFDQRKIDAAKAVLLAPSNPKPRPR